MPTLRADENRYLVQAEPGELALVRRIPGARWTGQWGWQTPRGPGVILAFDHVFGAGGWQCVGEAAELDAEAARARHYGPARHPASVRLESGQLVVRCDIADKDLVKLVPAYRWSPPAKAWYLPALPLALEILRLRFGEKLQVEREVEEFLELRAMDEQAALGSGHEQHAPTPSRAAAPTEPQRAATADGADTGQAGAILSVPGPVELPAAGGVAVPGDALLRAVESLAIQVERLTGAIGRLEERLAPVAPAPVAEAVEIDFAPAAQWQEILTQANDDPLAALDQAQRLLQTNGEGQGPLRAAAGIAAHRAGQLQVAYEHLARALSPASPLDDVDLGRRAAETYLAAVIHFLSDDLGPEETLTSVGDLRRLLLFELERDAGFDDARIGTPGARGTLERLVADPALRSVAPDLADFCRVAHLVAVVRGGGRMAAGQVADVLREESLHPDAHALLTILYANVFQGEPCLQGWVGQWPRELAEALPLDAARLARSSARVLPLVEPALSVPAALATLLALSHDAELPPAVRRDLLGQIPRGHGYRGPGEFLAAFRLAATGRFERWRDFPGYVEVLAATPLSQSCQHLQELFMTSGDDGLVGRVAEAAYLPALRSHGVEDPAAEVLDLLDLVATGPRPDQRLNELGRLLEDGGFEGADRFSQGQRRAVYEAALAASVRMGHDEDAREAFHRLARALEQEGAVAALRDLCLAHVSGFKPLRLPAILAYSQLLLESEGSRDEVLKLFDGALRESRGAEAGAFVDELLVIAEMFPAQGDAIRTLLAGYRKRAEPAAPPRFEGKRVLVVGGHQRLRSRALPVVEGWGVKIDWLEPEQAKQSDSVPQIIRAGCDLVVINTSYIGHAGSERAQDTAKSAGARCIAQPSNGYAAFLAALKGALSERQGERSKVEQRRKLARR